MGQRSKCKHKTHKPVKNIGVKSLWSWDLAILKIRYDTKNVSTTRKYKQDKQSNFESSVLPVGEKSIQRSELFCKPYIRQRSCIYNP